MRVFSSDEAGFAAPSDPQKRGKTLLVSLEVDTDFHVRRVFLNTVAVDGLDATETLLEAVRRLRRPPDLVLLPSACVAGFNIVDIGRIFTECRTPVGVVNPRKPRPRAVRAALREHFEDWRVRQALLDRMGPPKEISLGEGRTVYGHVAGMRFAEFRRVIRALIRFGDVPEPLRIARLVADAFSCFASRS